MKIIPRIYYCYVKHNYYERQNNYTICNIVHISLNSQKNTRVLLRVLNDNYLFHDKCFTVIVRFL